MNKVPQSEALQGLFYSLLLQKNFFYSIGTFSILKKPKNPMKMKESKTNISRTLNHFLLVYKASSQQQQGNYLF